MFIFNEKAFITRRQQKELNNMLYKGVQMTRDEEGNFQAQNIDKLMANQEEIQDELITIFFTRGGEPITKDDVLNLPTSEYKVYQEKMDELDPLGLKSKAIK